MAYFALLGLFLFFLPITKKTDVKNIITFGYIVLLLFASFRFGIGADYFSYNRLFSLSPEHISDFTLAKALLIGIEPGFALLMTGFKSFGLSYSYFIAFCAFVSLSLIIYTIQNYSYNKTASFFIFFANYYMVYIESVLRQSIAMAIFIYAFFDYITGRRGLKYIFLILIAMTFHVTAAITLIVPLGIKISKKIFINPLSIIILTMAALTVSFIIPRILSATVSGFYSKAAYYIKDSSFKLNLLPIGLRILEMIFVYHFFRTTHAKLSNMETACAKMFFIGILFYFSLSSIDVFSRLTEYFMFIEIALIPNLLRYFSKKARTKYYAVFSCLFIMLFLKDMHAITFHRQLKSHNILTYQYITIFNKEKINSVVSTPVPIEN
ncbi:MAG: EpsG family protein [Spirochaetaceae bacterium]|jgi:hypothetical protein|nr:EpsG family protein [Spirochaetaceae bacterium]